jgi:Uma2 family endonuclease
MSEPATPILFDDGGRWPAPGEWTYEDYLRLPDDGNRYEVIRGFLYVTAAPTLKHQFSVFELGFRLRTFIEQNGLGGRILGSIDVRLPYGIASPVQPDLVYFRPENEPDWEVGSFQGTPDLVVEVLSPSTRGRDRRIKLEAYRDAGVPEYWLVDSATRTILVCALRNGKYVDLCRGGVGERVRSAVVPGFEVEVADFFPSR